ncbi:hypothetical protein JCM1841_002349 [Sporobolomyces salmonicolor]
MSYQPLGTLPPGPRRGRWHALARSKALIAGAGVAVVLLLTLSSGAGRQAASKGLAKAKEYSWRTGGFGGLGGSTSQATEEEEDDDGTYVRPSKNELLALIGENPRFLTADGWATYGWNNRRYMLESTLLLAKVAGRIPVLPDFVWARSCAVESQTCANHALLYLENRNEHEDLLASRWNEPGSAFKLGLEHFLDLPHLRRIYGPLLTLSEFLDLYSIPPSAFDESLRWNVTGYNPAGMVTVTMLEGSFQNRTFVRVDQESATTDSSGERIVGKEGMGLAKAVVERALGDKPAWSLEQARAALEKHGVEVKVDDEELVRRLEGFDIVALHTFSDEVLMNKALSRPSVSLALRSHTQSLTTSLSLLPYANASIVYLQGNLHDQRKPGSIYFSTPQARDAFTEMVVRGVRAPRAVREVGERVARRMEQKVQGRRWVAGHLRRGDFVRIAWSPSTDPEAHFTQMRESLSAGIDVLRAHDPDRRLPQPADPFYLATDESNATSLALYRSRGAVLLSDLLRPEDLDTLGWPGSYGDVRALVEQQVLARSDFFVGSELSSTTGGAVNVRAALRKPDWSWSLLKRNGG